MRAVRVVVTGVVLGAMWSAQSGATNGYSPTGFGTTNKGLAGAGVALPQDALAGATNPAGMVHLGERIDVGLALFSPSPRGFTAHEYVDPDPTTPPQSIPPGSYESENDWFLMPSFGWNKPIDDVSSFGISIGANGGMNTEYDDAVWGNFGPASSPTGVDFAQLFAGFSYSRKLNDQHSIGIMPILAVQRFKAEGLEPFQGISVSPSHVTNNGYDYSWGGGLRVGWLGQMSDSLTLAASLQSRLYMSSFDKYRGLFAEQGDFDIPPTLVAGLAYKVTPDVTLVADYQRIWYSEIKALSNPNDQPITGPSDFLGADDGLGFGWEDIDIVKLGVQWEYSPTWTFRAGYSFASQLFEQGNALFNVLAPATPTEHASLGLTHTIGNHAISVAYTHAFNNEIHGQNPPFTGEQSGFVEMSQNELEVSWSYRF